MVTVFFKTNIQLNTEHHVRQEKSKGERSLQRQHYVSATHMFQTVHQFLSRNMAKYSAQEMAVCSHHIANTMTYTALRKTQDA